MVVDRGVVADPRRPRRSWASYLFLSVCIQDMAGTILTLLKKSILGSQVAFVRIRVSALWSVVEYEEMYGEEMCRVV